MEIKNVSGCPYEDNEGEVLNLSVQLDEGESLSKGGTIKIEMMDDSFIEREVKMINPKLARDYAEVSEKVRKSGWKRSENLVTEITGACMCDIVVMDVPYHEVKTDDEIQRREILKELESHSGEDSIYDNIIN